MTRVLVIGARRARQGIGEFVARWFHAAGANVCAVVGSSAATAAQGAALLAERYGIEARPYAGVRPGLDAEKPDVVAVCSPYLLHPEHLEPLAEAEVHCLCEKPMWWGDGDLGTRTAALVDPILERGKRFDLITQWPCTLPGFYRLHPHLRARPVERFEMLMGPITTSHEAAIDSLPHVISMLQALVGCGDVTGVEASLAGGGRELRLGFEYNPSTDEAPEPARPVAVECRLVTCEERPRPAAYAIDGCRVDRTIELPSYDMYLESSDPEESGARRRVPLEDPLDVLVRTFLRAVEAGTPASEATGPGVADHRRALIESVTLLEPMVHAVKKLEAGGSR